MRYDKDGIMMIIGKQKITAVDENMHEINTVITENMKDASSLRELLISESLKKPDGLRDLLYNIAFDAYLLGRMNGTRGERARKAKQMA